jgi:hypothetical protein
MGYLCLVPELQRRIDSSGLDHVVADVPRRNVVVSLDTDLFVVEHGEFPDLLVFAGDAYALGACEKAAAQDHQHKRNEPSRHQYVEDRAARPDQQGRWVPEMTDEMGETHPSCPRQDA